MKLLQVIFKRHFISDCCIRTRFLFFCCERDVNFNVLTSLRIFGIRIYKSVITNDGIICNLIGIFKWKVNCNFRVRDIANLGEIVHLCLPKINQNSNRHIVIFSLLGSPSGESFLVLNNLRYFRCFERSDAYICVDKRWKCVLCSMFAPGSNVIFIDKTIFTHILYSATFFIDSRRCTIYQFFPTTHYIEQDKLIKSKGIHYSDYIARKLEISRLHLSAPALSENDFIQFKSMAQCFKINLSRFVIICPEANSCSQSSDSFWKVVCCFLKANGFSVYVNSTKKRCEQNSLKILSHSELYALATQAKLIIGIRSGLLEILAMTGVPIIAIYNSFPKRGSLDAMKSSDVMTGFTLKKIPDISSQVVEFDSNNMSENDLINAIKEILRI